MVGVKQEPGSISRTSEMGRKGKAETGGGGGEGGSSVKQEPTERRVLRSRYMNLKSIISDERDGIFHRNADVFKSIISEVENLHQLVQKPREQVADAEALLDIANTLVTTVKSHGNGGVSQADFVTAVLRNSGQGEETARKAMCWMDIGTTVSHIFKKVPGCCTMMGPMKTEIAQRKVATHIKTEIAQRKVATHIKTEIAQRKVATHRKRTRPTQSTCPEELDEAVKEEKTGTDKNMSTMFEILRRKRNVRLECLILNRASFAQTVENVFALSFLVKDGRVEIKVEENGQHLVLPRNAPAASAISSGEVQYHHFVFRFDFMDWRVLKNSVGVGEELMPHRPGSITPRSSLAALSHDEKPSAEQSTPIRKFTRNRGSVVDNPPENDPVWKMFTQKVEKV